MSVIRRMVSFYVLALAAAVVLAGRSVWPQNPPPPPGADSGDGSVVYCQRGLEPGRQAAGGGTGDFS